MRKKSRIFVNSANIQVFWDVKVNVLRKSQGFFAFLAFRGRLSQRNAKKSRISSLHFRRFSPIVDDFLHIFLFSKCFITSVRKILQNRGVETSVGAPFVCLLFFLESAKNKI